MAVISLGLSSPSLELKATKVRAPSGEVKTMLLNSSLLSPLVKVPTCMQGPLAFAKEMRDQELTMVDLEFAISGRHASNCMYVLRVNTDWMKDAANFLTNFSCGFSTQAKMPRGYYPNPNYDRGGVCTYIRFIHIS